MMGAEKQNHYPAPLQLIFSDNGLATDVGCADDVPHGLVLCNSKHGCSITLEESQCMALSPLEIIYKGSKPKTLDVNLGPSARLTLIERYQDSVSQDVSLCVNLSSQAKLIHGQIITGTENRVQKASIAVDAAHGAFYDAFTLVAGAMEITYDAIVQLNGELSEARLLGVHILRGATKAEINWHVRHMAPYTVSRQIIKNVLNDEAQDSFTGKIYVDRIAQKTDGSQQSRGLLLSDSAEMRSRPELEIYADDVKCAHGSTTGDLDDDAMFYLQSRGISEIEARAMLIGAFVNGTVDQIRSEDLRAAVYMEIEKEMP